MTHPINTNKLVALAILGFCAVVLGGAVLSLQLQVMQQRQLLGYSPTQRHTRATASKSSSKSAAATSRTSYAATNTATNSPYNGHSSSSSQNERANIPPPLSSDDIFLHKSFPPPDSTSWKNIGEAYWQRVVPFLQWDILAPPPLVPSSSSRSRSNPGADPRLALRQAADAGHPAAQHLMANALASGIWPVGTAGLPPQQLDDNVSELHVLEDWSSQESPYYHHDDHGDPGFVARQHQLTQAMLYWRMAAIGGNVESAMAIAYRLNATMTLSPTLTDEEVCQRTLPYYEAAANGVMDLLEASEHSRAKVRPTMDRHSLATVHMHGESSASLGADNKPVESKEAIQYYHMTVAAMPHFSKVEERLYHRKSQSSTTTTTTTTTTNEPWSLEHLVDISKSETVAKEIKAGIKSARPIIPLYYHGKNGVDQNLTQALVYFETLAIHNVWDAAGKAGMFHLWGIGVPQNLNDALTFFQLGAPDTVEGCYHRRTKAQFRKRTNNDAPEVHECDDEALNGMGLLYLIGVPGRLPVDLAKAEKYFLLAKEMKNSDAAYNLAMMWLGWRTHFKRLDDLKDHGTSEDSSLDPIAMFPGTDQVASVGGATGSEKSSATYALHYSKRSLTDKFYKGPTKSEINDAMTLLAFAFNRGHLQAQHRLGLIYSEGVTIQTAALRYEAVKPSCKTARHIFEAIAYHANPILSDRLRKAYNDYNAGDWDSSLRNYLAAAETGSNIGQMNAAFLLERGVCLGLSPTDCAKASVRLWKAAATWGDAEAFLHVGDIYYYGRLRESSLPGSPFPWVQYFIYPEQYLPALVQRWGRRLLGMLAQSGALEDSSKQKHDQLSMHSDLTMAAHYYADAVSKFESPRANFNLGFMYEWGLGLKQDFPLAKRHYDLASSRSETGEADLAVQIALAGMSTHEFFIKLQMAWEGWGKPKGKKSQHKANDDGKPLAAIASGRTYGSILMDHMFDSSSLLIFLLTVAVFQLNALRQQRQIERMMQ